MKKIPASLFFALMAIAEVSYGGPRTSVSYSVVTEIADGGGGRASGGSYSQEGSVGAIGGNSAVVSPAETVKAGYLGQITEVTGLVVTASTLSVNELASTPLVPWQRLDDDTLVAVAASSATWSVSAGPLVIDGNGLATAGVVYENALATGQASYGGFSGSVGLTVVESIADNFGSYAGDGLGDDWQVGYFGLNNPQAGPTRDPDGDGQNNLFEYTAGLVPTDANSRFQLSIQAVAGQVGQMRLSFSPVVAGRSYVVAAKGSLSGGAYLPLSNGSAPVDIGAERVVIDQSAGGAAKFYRVEITK